MPHPLFWCCRSVAHPGRGGEEFIMVQTTGQLHRPPKSTSMSSLFSPVQFRRSLPSLPGLPSSFGSGSSHASGSSQQTGSANPVVRWGGGACAPGLMVLTELPTRYLLLSRHLGQCIVCCFTDYVYDWICENLSKSGRHHVSLHYFCGSFLLLCRDMVWCQKRVSHFYSS